MRFSKKCGKPLILGIFYHFGSKWTIYEILKESHLELLLLYRSVMENVPAHNFLTIPGDFNAKLGPDDAKFNFHDTETTRNRELLVDFMEEINLFPANTKFIISKKNLWTFE